MSWRDCATCEGDNWVSCYTLNKNTVGNPSVYGQSVYKFSLIRVRDAQLIPVFQIYTKNIVRRCVIQFHLFFNLRADFRLDELLPRPNRHFPAPLLSCRRFPGFLECAERHGILSGLRRSSSIAESPIVIVALLWSSCFSVLIILLRLTLEEFSCITSYNMDGTRFHSYSI
jgi:hypothetical protein